MTQFLWLATQIVVRTLAQVGMRVVAQAVMLTLSIAVICWLVLSTVIITSVAMTGRTVVPVEVTVALLFANMVITYRLARFAIRCARWDTRTPWRIRRPRQPLSEPTTVRRPR